MIAQKKSKKEEEDVVIQKAELKTKRKTIKFQQNSGVGCSRGKKNGAEKKNPLDLVMKAYMMNFGDEI